MNKISTTLQVGIAAAALALAWMTAGCEMVNQATSMAADVAAGAGVITQVRPAPKPFRRAPT